MIIKHLNFKFPVFVFSVVLSALAAAGDSYNGIVIFGDSLSDTGNKYFITGFANTPPYSELLQNLMVSDGPYAKGGLHHSNGATWIEQYTRPLGQAAYARPALRTEGAAGNYAYGGARASGAIVIVPNENQHLPVQVSNYLADVNSSASADALYVIFIGGNDIFDAVMALTFDPDGTTSNAIISNAVMSVGNQVARLSSAGAQRFVLMNAPDLGRTPVARLADAMYSPEPGLLIAMATVFSQAYNGGLMANLGGLPGVEIIDVYTLVNDVIDNPGEYGLSNSTDICVMPEQPPYACRNPDDYLFWDGIHPTSAAHGIFAEVFAGIVAD